MPAHRSSTAALTAALLLLAFASATTRAQDVVRVGPTGDVPLLVTAIAQAADGDILLVEDGYEQFETLTIDGKGLTIVAEGQATLTAFIFTGALPNLTVRGLTADQRVVVRGLDFLGNHEDPVTCVSVEDCAGPVVLEDCALKPSPGIALHVDGCASVTASRCDIGGAGGAFGNPGLRVDDSRVFLHGTDLGGANGFAGIDAILFQFPPVPGGDGAWVFGASELLVSGGSLRGGSGGGGGEICFGGADGGDGLRVEDTPSGSPVVRLRDVTPVAGTPGAGTCGNPDGQPGVDQVVLGGAVVPLAGSARASWLNAPVVVGDDVTLAFRGQPGDLAQLLLSPAFAPGLWLPTPAVALHLELPFVTAPAVLLPPSGELDLDLTVPSIPAGAAGVELATQSLFSAPGDVVVGAPGLGVFLAP